MSTQVNSGLARDLEQVPQLLFDGCLAVHRVGDGFPEAHQELLAHPVQDDAQAGLGGVEPRAGWK
jgi:hypothetical protein